MPKSKKTAWLIGLYNNDLEYRIKNLGYKLTRFYPDLNFDNKTEDPPLLIAFSEDQFSDPGNMEKLRDLYPKTVMIKLPLYPPAEHPSYHNPSQNHCRHAVTRLIMKIHETENRWDN